jgi:dipeptidyl aminopeptidase/acylaminoacyl peptidase
MAPGDIGLLTDVADPRLSPDGRTVAFTVTTIDVDENTYRSRVWLAAVDGSSAPRPFTAGDGRDRAPRWSPDGRSLAFVSHRTEGDGKGKGSELYVIPVEGGGEVRTVCAWPEEIDDIAWSPDGTRLAFGARERDEERYGKDADKDRPPRRITRLVYRLDSVGWTADRPRHLFVVPADGTLPPRAVTDGEGGDGGLAWTADGRSLLFSSSRHDDWDLDRAVDLFRVDVDSGQVTQLTKTGETFGAAQPNAAGDRIACVYVPTPMSTPRHGQVAVLPGSAEDGAGGAPLVLTASLDRQCSPFGDIRGPVWDGDTILFLVEDRGNEHVYRVPADGSAAPSLVLGGTRQVTGFDVRGDVMVYTATDAVTPTDLYAMSVGAGNERRLTHIGERLTAARTIAAPESFTAVAPDGAEVDAWIIRPLGCEPGRKYPALLNIHGGPFTQYGNRVFDEFQVQAAAGYAVVYSNPRGSSGFTEAWGRAIRGPHTDDDPGSGWGGVDYDDLMAVADEAVRRFDFVDADRFGVLGGSYGGFMTSWIVGHSDRFAAACSERAVNNRLTSCWTSDIGVWFRTQLGPSHLDAPEEYLERSPITYVKNVHTPLLILHSENDLRCPIEQAEQLFVALRMLGRDVEFVRFPGESHELTRSGAPRHRVQRFEILLDFFARKLGNSGGNDAGS